MARRTHLIDAGDVRAAHAAIAERIHRTPVFSSRALVPGEPLWRDVFVYATVFVTVLSGADYFFGLRRLMAHRSPPAPSAPRSR